MPKNSRIKNLRKIELGINQNLFIVSSIVTIVAMILVVTDFFARGAFLPARINFFYLGVVLVYSLHKEIIRWLGEKEVRRQGEYFVYAWIILTTALYVVNFFSKDFYGYSAEGYKIGTLRDISMLTMEVLGVFIFTRLLKLLFLLRKK